MKNKIISFPLILSLIISNMSYSLANDHVCEEIKNESVFAEDIIDENQINIEQIEGNTLLNLVSMPEIKEKRIEVLEETTTMSANFLNKMNIKPNTTYTYFVDIKPDYATANFYTSFRLSYLDKNNSIHNVGVNKNVTQNSLLFIIDTFTTGDSVKEFNDFSIIAKSTDENKAVGDHILNKMMILEGDYKNYNQSYFEGLKSVGQEDDDLNSVGIISNNKNLFNAEEWFDCLNDNGGQVEKVEEEGRICIKYSPHNTYRIRYMSGRFEKNTQYTLRFIGKSTDNNIPIGLNIVYMDGSMQYADTDKTEFNEVIVTTIPGRTIKYINTFYYKDFIGYIDLDSIQLTKTNTNVEYSPNMNNKLNIPLTEPLRAVGDIKDRIIKRNGNWVIERNCGETILDGSEEWKSNNTNNTSTLRFMTNIDNKKEGIYNIINDKFIKFNDTKSFNSLWVNGDIEGVVGWSGNNCVSVGISKDKLDSYDIEGFKSWLRENPITIIHELDKPIYEPLNIDLKLNYYKETTNIYSDSIISPTIKISINRTENRAKEAIELAKESPTMENLAKARMWVNLLRESALKDNFQEQISNISEFEDLTLDRKTVTANLDVYIKSENMLSMSLDTNSVSFDNYSGAAPMELTEAVNITINSSLPYDLNAYMPSEISNSDGSSKIPFSIFNIKESTNTNYQQFTDITNKLTLKSDCAKGNGNNHKIDLKLDSDAAHKADIYKTVLKFEVEQK